MQALADRYRVKSLYTDWRAVIDDPSIDVVAVLTPPGMHFEMTMAAVKAGKHVMVEKPLTADLGEADRLIRETASSSAKIMIAYCLRFHQQIIRLRELIRSGALGRIEFVRGVATSPSYLRPNFPEYRKKRVLGGGVVIELAVHYYDLWEYLLDTRIQSITAMSRSSEGEDMTAFVGTRTTSGVLVSGEFSCRATEQHEIEVYGEQARAKASLYRFDGLRVFGLGTYEGGLAERLGNLRNAAEQLPDALRAVSGGGVFLDTFRRQWLYFLRCIRNDQVACPGLPEGRRSLAVALAAVRAIESGKTVNVLNAGGETASGESGFGC
jgi:predicted dehydrogenase